MLLPRQDLAGATSETSVTADGEIPSYSCNIVCGIGIGVGVSLGILLLLSLWSWYWLSRPRNETPMEIATEASRQASLARNSPEPPVWVKHIVGRAVSAISPFGPALRRITGQSPTKVGRSPSQDSKNSRTKLVKKREPKFVMVEPVSQSVALGAVFPRLELTPTRPPRAAAHPAPSASGMPQMSRNDENTMAWAMGAGQQSHSAQPPAISWAGPPGFQRPAPSLAVRENNTPRTLVRMQIPTIITTRFD